MCAKFTVKRHLDVSDKRGNYYIRIFFITIDNNCNCDL